MMDVVFERAKSPLVVGIVLLASSQGATSPSRVSAQPEDNRYATEEDCHSPSIAPAVDVIPANTPGLIFFAGSQPRDRWVEHDPPRTAGLEVTNGRGDEIGMDVAYAGFSPEVRFSTALQPGETLRFEANDPCSESGDAWERTLTVVQRESLPSGMAELTVGPLEEGIVQEIWGQPPAWLETSAEPRLVSTSRGVKRQIALPIDDVMRTWLPFMRFSPRLNGSDLMPTGESIECRPTEDSLVCMPYVNCEDLRNSPIEEGQHEFVLWARIYGTDNWLESNPVVIDMNCTEAMRADIRLRGWTRQTKHVVVSNWPALLAIAIAALAGVFWLRRRMRS